MSHGTQRVLIADARQQMGEFGSPTEQSKLRFDEIIRRLELFAARGFQAKFIDEVTTELAKQFIKANGRNGEPSTATMHVRRAALRLLFRIARLELGFDGEPTLDLVLPPRSVLTSRPLTDDEVAVGRSYSLHTFSVTRQPAAWALSEATATTSELPHITIDDLDLDNGRAWLHGSHKRTERWGFVDEWAAKQLERRASALRGTRRLIYSGSGGFAAQISCCNAIKETLIRAGLDNEPDVRPGSLPAWAGRSIFEQTGSIQEAAARLGMGSLDAAAAYIALSWR